MRVGTPKKTIFRVLQPNDVVLDLSYTKRHRLGLSK